MLKSRRQQNRAFSTRNQKRWKKGLDLLETMLVVCIELGESFYAHYRNEAIENEDLVFDVLIKKHARCCQITEEILCLLQNGFADGAHARWRSLHEVVTTGLFIKKHGQESAIRFLHHEAIENHASMTTINKYRERIDIKPFSDEEISTSDEIRNELLQEYGKDFKEPYGWASLFLKNKNPKFSDIEADVNLGHMRPYYKWASQNVHATIMALTNKLGLLEQEPKTEGFLVGRSNSGIVIPAHAAAFSLAQITNHLLTSKITMDSVIYAQLISTLQEKVENAFS